MADRINYAPMRDLGDVEAQERVPLAERLPTFNSFELVRRGAMLDPDLAAFIYLPDGELVDAPFTLTYRELLARFTQCANLLRDLGLGPTDVVAFLMPNLPQNFYVQIGGLATGIVCCVNWMLEAPRIADILRAAKAKVVVALGPTPGFEIWQKLQFIRGELPDLEHLLSVQGLDGERIEESDFDLRLAAQPGDALIFEREFSAGDVASYVHSGGTTGSPKLARITHGGLAYKCYANVEIMAYQPGEVMFSDYPMFHIAGFIGRGLLPFVTGMTMMVPAAMGARSKNFIKNYWKLVERYGINYFSGVPTTLSVLIDTPRDGEDISSLRPFAPTGSAPLPTETSKRIERELGVRMLTTYGSTELTQNATMIPRDGEMRHGSTGIRMPYSQVKTVIVDANGRIQRDCGPGEIGVVTIKGPGVFPGYVEEALNAEIFFEGGWLNTGDLGRLDAEGYLWLTGRAKDVIIRGGHNIDPSIIEESLTDHEAVRLAAAVGEPEARLGEMPVAFVQLRDGAEATEMELKDWARERITERAANPARIVIMEKMPLTDIGKPNKVVLRHEAARRVFAELLGSLAGEGLELEVEVGLHASAGSMAGVSVKSDGGQGRTEIEAKVHDLLSKFSMAHQMVWD